MAKVRLIDANTLKAEFAGNFHEMWHYTGIRAMIDNAPTIDPDSLRPKGRWEAILPIGAGAYTNAFECSACHTISLTYIFLQDCEFDYCPNCGAKMEV